MKTKRILAIILALILTLSVIPFGGMISSSAKTIEEYSVGDIIEFGSYPQSKVTDEAVLTELKKITPDYSTWTSYGYYSGTGSWDDGQMTASDYMKYTDISYDGNKYRAVKFTSYRPFCTGISCSNDNNISDQYRNGYHCNCVYYFKFEKLKWVLLDNNSNLVVCNIIVDSQPYNSYVICVDKNYYNESGNIVSDWSTSSYRRWLNNEFYNLAFNKKEKELICNSKISNNSYPDKINELSTESYDKIFVLSAEEITKYNSDYTRIATDYAYCQGCNSHQSKHDWWIRNANSNSSLGSCIMGYNNCIWSSFKDKNGFANVNIAKEGVVPAFKFNPKSIINGTKKAIIVVPGITGSELYSNTLDGEKLTWLPDNLINVNTIAGLIDQLKCDEYGNSRFDYYTKDEKTSPYGTWDTYKDLVDSLRKKYDSDYGGDGSYDVHFFSYDWRLTNTIAASKLKEFIADYDSVVLVCHSMGGIVGSIYMAENGIDKVEKFISLGTPYYGAPKATYTFETGRFLDDTGKKGDIEAFLIKRLAPYIPGIFELLPTEEYGNYLRDSSVNLNYQNTITYLSTKKVLKARSWYNEYFYNQAEYVHNLAKQGYSYITNGLVDSYVIVGYKTSTIDGLFYNSKQNYLYKDISIGDGDGTVPLYSATMGYAKMSRNPYYVKRVNHTDLAKDWDVVTLVNNIIDGNPETYSSKISHTGAFISEKFSGQKIIVDCPVTMEIYDKSGEKVGYISEDEIEFANGYENCFYQAGEKCEGKIAYLDNNQYSFLIKGYDEGTMDLSIQKFEDGLCVENDTYSKVNISYDTKIDFSSSDKKIKVDFNGDGVEDYYLDGKIEKINLISYVVIDDIELKYKKSVNITPNINADEGANYTVSYSSSNEKVATVDQNGKVYGAKRGDAKITCTVTDSNGNTVSDTCNVTVSYAWWQWLIKILLFGWIWY